MVQKDQKNKNMPLKKSLYTRFLGFIIKKGKKTCSRKILNNAFFLASQRLKKPVHLIMIQIFLKLNTFSETKKIRVRRSSYNVPFPLSRSRRFYLIVKWLFDSAKENTQNIPLQNKVSTEIISILAQKSSKTLKKKQVNLNQSLSNRSNSHYRW